MMNEALEVIPQLMSTDRFPGYQGKYFTIGPNRNVIPKPIQKPHPPMWMACSSPQSFDIAANAGLGVLSFNIIQAQTLEERVRNYRQAIAKPAAPVVARVNDRIATFMMTLCGENNDQSIEMAGEGMHWYMSALRGQTPYWQNIFEKGREEIFSHIDSYKYMSRKAPEALSFGADLTDEKARREMSPKRLVERGLLCAGNPDTCIEVLERFEKLGIDLILCFMEMGRVPHQRTMESIKLFGKHVIPHFKQHANGQSRAAGAQA
jgi:alkanesulfonate monooxygenase SsuD/methylene tetrahydromethanopterin reductase-like flavin-dependent oxidoreductase (luciferase family)